MSQNNWELIKLEHERRVAEMEREIQREHDPRRKPRRRARNPQFIQAIIRTLSS